MFDNYPKVITFVWIKLNSSLESLPKNVYRFTLSNS